MIVSSFERDSTKVMFGTNLSEGEDTFLRTSSTALEHHVVAFHLAVVRKAAL